jgi:predicted nucleic acid-binding protein
MSRDFIDSNVFLYQFDETSPTKRAAAEAMVNAALSNDAAISWQVVQEVVNGLLRKVSPAPPRLKVEQFLSVVLAPLWTVMPSPDLYLHVLRIRERYQLSFWDALIVAAARSAKCERILTEDLQHGQSFEGVFVHNPFPA